MECQVIIEEKPLKKRMLFFSQKTHIPKRYIYAGILFICAVCHFSGIRSGTDIEAVYSFKPEACAVKTHNSTDNRLWLFPQHRTESNSCCNESLKGLKYPGPGEFHVAYSYSFSFGGNKEKDGERVADWIQSLKAFIVLGTEAPASFTSADIEFEAVLLYKDNSDPETKWTTLASTQETRMIDCLPLKSFKGYLYGCTILPIFQLLAVRHDNYRLNIQFIGNASRSIPFISNMPHLSNTRLVLRHEDVPFTKTMAYLKAWFLPLTVAVHLWFFEVHRPLKTALDRIMFSHSMVLVGLNTPFEFLWMLFNCPMLQHIMGLLEVMFQSSLFISWIFFNMYLFYKEQKILMTIIYYISPCFVVIWFALSALTEYKRESARIDPFYSPWENCVTAFMELSLYDFICGMVGFFATMTMAVQFIKLYTKMNSKNSTVWFWIDEKLLGYNITSIFKYWSCLLMNLSMIILQSTLNSRVEFHWKVQPDDTEEKFFRSPAVFTWFLGIRNILAIALLLLLPGGTMKKNTSLKSLIHRICNVFEYRVECCVHSWLSLKYGDLETKHEVDKACSSFLEHFEHCSQHYCKHQKKMDVEVLKIKGSEKK